MRRLGIRKLSPLRRLQRKWDGMKLELMAKAHEDYWQDRLFEARRRLESTCVQSACQIADMARIMRPSIEQAKLSAHLAHAMRPSAELVELSKSLTRVIQPSLKLARLSAQIGEQTKAAQHVANAFRGLELDRTFAASLQAAKLMLLRSTRG
jgi:hypothetical protein